MTRGVGGGEGNELGHIAFREVTYRGTRYRFVADTDTSSHAQYRNVGILFDGSDPIYINRNGNYVSWRGRREDLASENYPTVKGALNTIGIHILVAFLWGAENRSGEVMNNALVVDHEVEGDKYEVEGDKSIHHQSIIHHFAGPVFCPLQECNQNMDANNRIKDPLYLGVLLSS